MQLKPVTVKAIQKAIKAVIVKFRKQPKLFATNQLVGYIIPPGQKKGEREGLAVFLHVRRYSDKDGIASE